MTKEDIIKPENLVYQKPRLLNDNPMHYCPGCSHGVVHKLIAEVIDEMGMAEKAVGVSPVGCAVFMYNYLDIDCQEAAHGRAPALATAIKRLWPDRLVFTIRTSKTEYISCPGCGRTLYDLESTIARIKTATSHLKGLKIGIMGCIVNGPGEMADATMAM